MKKYTAPDFDISVYELEDVLTVNLSGEIEGGDDGWFEV